MPAMMVGVSVQSLAVPTRLAPQTIGPLTGLVAVSGPNGAGKSTLLRAIAGQERHLGTVNFTKTPRLALLPQRVPPPRWPLTVAELVHAAAGGSALWRRWRLVGGEALALAGAEALALRPLSSLSGGEYQRALFAGALAQRPTVLLLDEPETSLDAAGVAALDALWPVLAERGITCLWATHDAARAAKHAAHQLVLSPEAR